MVFLEIWQTIYIPKTLDTTNMKLLYEIENMFNKFFGKQPKWYYDEAREMYYTQLMFGAIPFLTSQQTITNRFNAIKKYGFLDKNLQPFK